MKDNLIKLYFYVTAGQAVVDKFRYLIMGIFAVYVMLKLTNPMYLALMFVVSIPVLFITGWYYTHKVASVSDMLSTKYGTHYQIKQYELIEEQVILLKQIRDKFNERV